MNTNTITPKTEAISYINRAIEMFNNLDPDIPAEIASEFKELCVGTIDKYNKILCWTDEYDFPEATNGAEWLHLLWEAVGEKAEDFDDVETRVILGMLGDRVDNGDDFEY